MTNETKYREKLNAILVGLEVDSIERAELFGGLHLEFRRDMLADVARYRGLVASTERFLRADKDRAAALEAMRVDFSDGIPGRDSD